MAEVTFQSPLGPLRITSRDGAITGLDWDRAKSEDSTPELDEACRQLGAYFGGTLTRFDLPVHVDGSAFQRDICDQIAAIPFGETRSYGDIARALGVPAQAVGTGCGGNPIAIIIPCHRVLGTHGLGGFSGKGGVETKVWLLRHEGAGGLLI